MSITVLTDNPDHLLQNIYTKINKENVTTWLYDQDGDLTYLVAQWRATAWFTPWVLPYALVFGFLGNSNTPTTQKIFGIYHGRLIEMLTIHFDDDFDHVIASSLADPTYDTLTADNVILRRPKPAIDNDRIQNTNLMQQTLRSWRLM